MNELHDIHTRLKHLESSLYLPDRQSSQPASSDTLATAMPPRQLQCPPPSPSLSSDVPLGGIQQHLTTLVNSILQADDARSTEEDISVAYFKHINKWLPILSPKKFHEQLSHGRSMVGRPETDLLLICMYLLLKDPYKVGPLMGLHKLYRSARSAYFMLQAESTGSIELAQSGLMLATYEHASGFVEWAYATIWTCVQMTHSLRLQDKFQRDMSCDHGEQIECAEAHALWWAILIRDR
jgi:hypothetical protein